MQKLQYKDDLKLGFDPMKYTNLAQCAMAIYQAIFFESRTIGIANEQKKITSVECIKRLAHFSQIRSAVICGDQTIFCCKVDGYCEETLTVYKYYGYFWHS